MKSDIKTIFRYVKNFRINSIFFRNFLTIMLIILIPVTVASTYFSISTQRNVKKEMSLNMRSHLSIVKNSVDEIVRTVERLAIQTSLSSNVEAMFLAGYNDSSVTKLYREIRNYIGNFTNVYPYINSIYVYSEKTGVLIENQDVVHINEHADTNWYDTYKSAAPNTTVIMPRKKGGTYPSFISVIRSVGIADVGTIGCVIINIDIKKINESINTMGDINLYNLMIVGNNKIFLSRDLKQVGQNFFDYFDVSKKDKYFHDDIGNVSINGDDYLYSSLNSEKYDFSYISFIPTTYFRSAVDNSILYMITIIALIFFSAILITFLISIRTYVPIRRILNILMPSYEIGKSVYHDASNDEAEYIINSIRKTIDRNSELSEELNYRLILLNKAQIYALQTQINPHFLNNILETINWVAIRQLGPKNNISKMIRALSVLFEVSLDSDRFLIPIREEMHHSNVYIYLMDLNYGEEIHYIWEIEDEISDFKMLKLTLQPILENAIYHGIKPKKGKEKGEIKVKGEFYNGGILFSIHDNGVGMAKEELTALQNSLKGDVVGNMHIGIKNVDQRIKLVFGDEYGLTVESQKDVGTTVKIFIPKIGL